MRALARRGPFLYRIFGKGGSFLERAFLLGFGLDEAAVDAVMGAFGEALKVQQALHEEAMKRCERGADVRAYLAGQRFVNDATREYYAAQIEKALDAGEGEDAAEVLLRLTTGEDGGALPGIFEADLPRALVNLAPAKPVDGEVLDALLGQMRRAQVDLNKHRIAQ